MIQFFERSRLNMRFSRRNSTETAKKCKIHRYNLITNILNANNRVYSPWHNALVIIDDEVLKVIKLAIADKIE